jgi:hypothetical protein
MYYFQLIVEEEARPLCPRRERLIESTNSGLGTSMIRICQGEKHFSLHLTGEFSEALVWV